MTLTRFAAVIVFAALPLGAQAQQSSPPKPTVAAAQEVVKMISADKAKLKIYCDLGDMAEQLDAAEEKKDLKTAEALADKMDALAEQLGPEYTALVDGLQDLNENDKEGEAIAETLSELDEMCTK
jgi:hypothetical protein